ncbi:MAG TPA: TetR/AcrR family transcriptional regulator [Ktedonobacterales bacterium]|nr:TetR/AcrR family transcriptional regulator [Ktedonobacterales bacterium]
MPYSKAHKARTRAKIVEAATHAFRAEGMRGVGIPQVMRQAGLTHGGFYAHFESKDELAAEACTASVADSVERLVRKAARTSPDDAVRAIISLYLTTLHRDTPASGCMIPALAGEIAHSPAVVRAAFTQGLADYARQLGAYLPTSAGSTSERQTDDALVLLAGMAGALLLARAVDDPEMSERILDTARAFYTRTYGGGTDADEPSRAG